MLSRTVVISVLLVLSSTDTWAQLLYLDVPAGARARVSAPMIQHRPFVGNIRAFDSASLTLVQEQGETRLRIPVDAIQRLEISEGPDRGRGALAGALVGFGGSVALGFACQALCKTGDGANFALIGGVALGIFVGVPLGAVVGGTAFAPEAWRIVDMRHAR